MSVCRHTSRIYIDPFDLDGVLKVLGDRIEFGGEPQGIYIGAYIALDIIRSHEDVRDQSIYMEIFDNILRKEGF